MTTKPSPAPWSVDTVRNEGEYGSGPDTCIGFDSYAVYDANGRALFDSINSDVAEIHTSEHDTGIDAWDDVARENLTVAAAAPELLRRALDVLEGLEGMQLTGAMPVRVEKLRAAIAKAMGSAS